MKKSDESFFQVIVVFLLLVLYAFFVSPRMITAKSAMLPFLGVVVPCVLLFAFVKLCGEYRRQVEIEKEK